MNESTFSVDKPDLGYSFNTKKDLEKWADNFFFGGYSIKEIEKDQKKILILIGSFNSGIYTSYLRIYLNKNDKIELLLVRETVPGKISIKEDKDNLVIINDNNPLLIIPWNAFQLHSLNK